MNPSMQNNPATLHLYLISDSSAETVSAVARTTVAQLKDAKIAEHVWPLTRTQKQIDDILEQVRQNPGVVMCTIFEEKLEGYLISSCNKLKVPCLPILSRIVKELSSYFNVARKNESGKQYSLDEEYFARIDAINYTLAHDDCQCSEDLSGADIIIIGASRTSKSPTSIYLAYRGYKVANIPFVHKIDLPESLFKVKDKLIVGLTINPERLIQIRRNRLLSINENNETVYINQDSVNEELSAAKKTFLRNNWPTIDVTKRSVEEIAATIIRHFHKKGRVIKT
ncbi:putative pyruvate, phosphate dikinase regulatory protein [Rickettsiales bacterium]|nr:putative pyruvate, phosphate dikinase regulatory protein [Rickettsiales bacterium]